jgi:hypothetical protein
MKSHKNGAMPNSGDLKSEFPANSPKENGSDSGVKSPTAGKKPKTRKGNKPGDAKRKKGKETLEPFAAGDLVVAINTDMSAPVFANGELAFEFPDGPLKSDVVYQVTMACLYPSGHQGVFLNELKVINGSHEIPWHHSRFRKA